MNKLAGYCLSVECLEAMSMVNSPFSLSTLVLSKRCQRGALERLCVSHRLVVFLQVRSVRRWGGSNRTSNSGFRYGGYRTARKHADDDLSMRSNMLKPSKSWYCSCAEYKYAVPSVASTSHTGPLLLWRSSPCCGNFRFCSRAALKAPTCCFYNLPHNS